MNESTTTRRSWLPPSRPAAFAAALACATVVDAQEAAVEPVRLQWPSDAASADRVISRIAFGSCAKQSRPQPIWSAIRAFAPDVFVFLGDNIYGDTDDMEVLRAKWNALLERPDFAAFVSGTGADVLATWDDHDYGRNDAGREYEHREASQQLFLDAFGVPAESPRRSRAGVYHAQIYGPPGRRVQFVLLDTRYHRSALRRGEPAPGGTGAAGPYRPDPSPDAAILGDEQWRWLEDQLRVPAELRVVCSSIQVHSTVQRYEHWGNFPVERDRLLRTIRAANANGVVLLTGDRHAAEVSVLRPVGDPETHVGYPLLDVTSSPLNQTRGWGNERNPHRVGSLVFEPNFGTLEVDWDAPRPRVRVHVRGLDGAPLLRHVVFLDELRPPPRPEDHRPAATLSRIGLVSCVQQDRPQPLWNALLEREPDLCILAGDNVYGDTDDMTVLRAKYERLAADPDFARFRGRVPLIGTWDDHDYGRNDAGAEYPHKRASADVFFDFFDVATDSPRRSRDGIYGSVVYGPPERSVQVILLDTRTFRSPLVRRTLGEPAGGGRPGPYAPNHDPDATLLGAAQWAWLAERLRVPARVRLLVSSVQVLTEGHAWECWANFPHERARLFATLRASGAGGVVLLSGDMHIAELARVAPHDSGVAYPLHELTSSGLNQAWEFHNYRNDHRVGAVLWDRNWGLVSIDWEREDPLLTLEARRADGRGLVHTVSLSRLQPAR